SRGPCSTRSSGRSRVPAGRGTGFACWSRRAGPAGRSIPRASSATAPRAPWASPWRGERPRRAGGGSRARRPAGGAPPPGGGGGGAVEPAAELADALGREFGSSVVLVMAAAPADLRPRRAAGEKIHREGSGGLELDLEETEDILASLGARRRDGQTIVGFAA